MVEASAGKGVESFARFFLRANFSLAVNQLLIQQHGLLLGCCNFISAKVDSACYSLCRNFNLYSCLKSHC